MDQWISWTLPMPVIGKPGQTVTLDTMFKQSFGGTPANAEGAWLTYLGLDDMTQRDWDFWNPDARQLDRWFVTGRDIGSGFDHQRYIDPPAFAQATMKLGNTIGPVSFLTIPMTDAAGQRTGYIEYSVMTIDPSLMLSGAGKRAPTAADIVAQAYRFDAKYGNPVNTFDCHFIAAAVAASAGATFTAGGNTQNTDDPSQNIEHGFWRIAYRGSDPHPTDNWQSLVKPGDIVRMGWNDGGFHTATILSVSADKQTITVYDNGGNSIGVHEVNYGAATRPDSITVYRLTTDNTYLETGTATGDRLPGTIFNDKVLGLSGNDMLFGAAGNDWLDGGKGKDKLAGGQGNDTYIVDNSGDQVSESSGQGLDTVRASVTHTLAANVENLELLGGSIGGTGNALANAITGNGGGNVLAGLGGRDVLTGGSGSDTFEFRAVSDSTVAATGRDRIVDFSHAQRDRIDLHMIDADTGRAGDQVFHFIGNQPFKHQAGDLQAVYSGADTVVRGDIDGNGAADFAIVLQGHVALVGGDFIL